MRFLLAAVIIQDIGLPLDSNHSGEKTLGFGLFLSLLSLLAVLLWPAPGGKDPENGMVTPAPFPWLAILRSVQLAILCPTSAGLL